MELWIWILLAALVVVLVVVLVATLRAIRPKSPEPLDAGFATPSAGSPAGSPRGPRPPAPATLTPAAIAEIDALVAREQRISAIKVLREAAGLSLREAKDRIDAWVPSASGGRAAPATFAGSASRPAGAPSAAQGGSAADAVAHLSPEVRAEIGRLIAADQKISAIKALRAATGLGLKDSKDAVESWR